VEPVIEGRRATFILPGGLQRSSGGNVYDRVMVEALRSRGWRVGVSETSPVRADGPEQADGVVIQDSLAIPAGPPAGPDRLVALLHQLPSEAEERPSWREAERSVLRSASLVVAVSRHLAERASRETEAPVVVVSPGWDRAYAVARSDEGTVLCVANAGRRKGVADAIAAFEQARLGRARFVLAGDPRRDALEAERVEAFAAALGPDLIVDGVLEPAALAHRYATARVFLSASRYEGWPIAVAEAMASGLPIVAFDVAGVRELVRSGEDGILCEVGDIEGLARAVGRLWSDPVLSGRMGNTARLRARGWPTWADAGRRFVDVLESYARGDPHPADAE
jgi:glycosyltransferase involved in cell wall biosynthesis